MHARTVLAGKDAALHPGSGPLLRHGRVPTRVRRRQDKSGSPVQHALSPRALRAGQLEQTLRMSALSICLHVGAIMLADAIFWNRAGHRLLLSLTCVVLLLACSAGIGARRWLAEGRAQRRTGLGVACAAGLAALLSLSWSCVPLLLFPRADAGDRLVIVGLMAGIISNGFVVGPLYDVTLAFTLPLTLSCVATLIGTGGPAAPALALLLCSYTVFVLASAFQMSRVSSARVASRLRLAQQTATVGLLLKDFEEGASDWLWEVDDRFRLRQVSARFAAACGTTRAALEGSSLLTLLEGEPNAPAREALEAARLRGIPFRDVMVRVTIADDIRWWSLTGKRLDPVDACAGGVRDGAASVLRGVGSDVTAARVAELRISELAATDFLTGLANRAVFNDALADAAACARDHGRRSALFYIDLDRFKEVNDTLGHDIGDALLRAVAARLVLSAGRDAVVARLGGDEFAIVIAADDAARVAARADAVVTQVIAPYLVEGISIGIGVSVGIAILPDDAQDGPGAIRCADLALYEAKSRGCSAFAFYEPGLGLKASARQSMRHDLRLALMREEFELHYQPIVDLARGSIDGFEALLRWNHPLRGQIAPMEFIPVAEALGLIVHIGAWVLERACAEAVRWPQEKRLAVNLSAVQFRSGELLATVEAALRASGLAPTRLELEITETALLDRSPATLETLHRLRALGVRIALDDFGVGYASLGYLVTFPFDRIKVDRSFVRDLGAREDCAAIVDAVIGLARRVGMEVTAEGVESEAQAASLRARGCDQIQGFLISAPVAPEHLPGMMARWTGLDERDASITISAA